MAENNQEMTPMEKKVAEQIEYYFSDHNLPRDKFLKEQIQLDDGWVSLETMIKFNRLSRLTTDFKVIVEALKKSQSGLLEIHEDGTKIRRSLDKPLPEVNDEYKDGVKHRSVYMKGFPLDATLDDLKEWLDGKGKIESIQMRRNLQRQFKGSVFIVFDTDASAKQFVQLPDLKYKDNETVVLLKEDYYVKKNEERKQYRAEAKAKAKQEKEEKQKQAEDEEMKSLDEQTGCLLKFSGELEQTSREDFHEIFASHGQIKWIDFIRGAKEGTILFKASAKEALDKATEANGGNLQIKKKDIKWEVLEGDVEKEMLKKIIEDQQETMNKRRGRGGRKFGGRGRGGRRDRDRGGRDQGKTHYQGKKTKFDSEEEEDAAPASPKKRALEAKSEDVDEPAAKQIKTEIKPEIKTENGSEKQ